MGKPFYKSKTFWFNVLFLVVSIAEAFGYADFVPGGDVQNLAVGLIAVVNILLRFVTREPIHTSLPWSGDDAER